MHSQLEQYLQTVEQNLGTLPAEERHNELCEIRQHMEALLEANRELCDTEEEAVAQTLAQFGRAQALGKNLNRVHQSKGRSRLDTVLGAMGLAYVSGSVASMITGQIFMAIWGTSHKMSNEVGFIWLVCDILRTFWLGTLIGAVAPRSAVRGVLYVRLIVAAVGTLMLFRQAVPEEVIPMLLTSTLIETVVFMALSICGVKLGIFWRNRRSQKLRLAR